MKLTTPAQFTKSINDNEDGFFLRLYQFIRECQILMNEHLTKYFSRERQDFIVRGGGFL